MIQIIELIIKIFQAVFEEDREKRARTVHPQGGPVPQARPGAPPPPGAAPRPGAPQPQGQRPGQLPPRQPNQPPRTLDEWMQSLFQEETGQAPPPLPTRTPPRKPAAPVTTSREETLEEHLRASQNRLKKQQARIRKMEERLRGKMGEQDAHYATVDQSGQIKIPGKTPLERMIYANVILDPCKARRRTHSFKDL